MILVNLVILLNFVKIVDQAMMVLLLIFENLMIWANLLNLLNLGNQLIRRILGDSGESGDYVGSGNSLEYGDPGEYSNFGEHDDFDEPHDFGYSFNSGKYDQYGQYGDCDYSFLSVAARRLREHVVSGYRSPFHVVTPRGRPIPLTHFVFTPQKLPSQLTEGRWVRGQGRRNGGQLADGRSLALQGSVHPRASCRGQKGGGCSDIKRTPKHICQDISRGLVLAA